MFDLRSGRRAGLGPIEARLSEIGRRLGSSATKRIVSASEEHQLSFVDVSGHPTAAVAEAAAAIMKRSARKYVGGGIVNSGAAEALLALAEELQLPVTRR